MSALRLAAVSTPRGDVAGKDRREPCASGNRAEKGREKSVSEYTGKKAEV